MNSTANKRAERLARTFLVEPDASVPPWVRVLFAATWATTRRDLAELLLAGRELRTLAVVVAAGTAADALGLDGPALTGSMGATGTAVAGAARDREAVAAGLRDPARKAAVLRAGDEGTVRVVAARRDGAVWIGDVALRRGVEGFANAA